MALAAQSVLQASVDLYDELEPWRSSQHTGAPVRVSPAYTCQMRTEFYDTCQVAQQTTGVSVRLSKLQCKKQTCGYVDWRKMQHAYMLDSHRYWHQTTV